MGISGMDNISPNHDILIDKFSRIRTVCYYAANFRRAEEYIFWTFLCKKSGYLILICQIKFFGISDKEFLVSTLYEAAQNCGAYQSFMSGNIDFGMLIHHVRFLYFIRNGISRFIWIKSRAAVTIFFWRGARAHAKFPFQFRMYKGGSLPQKSHFDGTEKM